MRTTFSLLIVLLCLLSFVAFAAEVDKTTGQPGVWICKIHGIGAPRCCNKAIRYTDETANQIPRSASQIGPETGVKVKDFQDDQAKKINALYERKIRLCTVSFQGPEIADCRTKVDRWYEEEMRRVGYSTIWK